MIVRARTVLPMDGSPLENGAVAISGEHIVAVGTFEHIKKEWSGDILDLGEQLLLPGLINAHCHLDYTRLRGRIRPRGSFCEWIRAINSEKAGLSANDYVASISAGIAEAVRFGTTSIVNFEAFPEIASQLSPPIRIWWLGEMIDVRSPESAANLVAEAVRNLERLPNWGLAPHAPFTASTDLYRNCANVGRAKDVPLSTHLAESAEEMQMFAEGSGELYAFLRSIGRDMADCQNRSPLSRFLASVANNQTGTKPDLDRWIVAHLNTLTETDFGLLGSIGSAFHVVHCPRSHQYFGHSRFEFDRLRRLRFNVCLGTDSLASNEDLNLFAEMRSFLTAHPQVSRQEAVQMVTVNPAAALGCEHLLGRMRESSRADLIAIPDAGVGNPYDRVVEHVGPVSWRMAAGTILAA
ncbi:MAG: amidohydrolase family protein [Chthoniobacterales bacterium]